MLKPCPLPPWPGTRVWRLQGEGRPAPTQMPSDYGLRSCQRAGPGPGIASLRILSPTCGVLVTLRAPSLANNLSQFYRTRTASKADQTKPAKAQAAPACPTSTLFQGPPSFSRARTQGRGGPGSRWLGSRRGLYQCRENSWLSGQSVFDRTPPGSRGRAGLHFPLGSQQRNKLFCPGLLASGTGSRKKGG